MSEDNFLEIPDDELWQVANDRRARGEPEISTLALFVPSPESDATFVTWLYECGVQRRKALAGGDSEAEKRWHQRQQILGGVLGELAGKKLDSIVLRGIADAIAGSPPESHIPDEPDAHSESTSKVIRLAFDFALISGGRLPSQRELRGLSIADGKPLAKSTISRAYKLLPDAPREKPGPQPDS